jgi:hypothetical protein
MCHPRKNAMIAICLGLLSASSAKTTAALGAYARPGAPVDHDPAARATLSRGACGSRSCRWVAPSEAAAEARDDLRVAADPEMNGFRFSIQSSGEVGIMTKRAKRCTSGCEQNDGMRRVDCSAQDSCDLNDELARSRDASESAEDSGLDRSQVELTFHELSCGRELDPSRATR